MIVPSTAVLYLPAAAVTGCFRVCVGVRRGDVPRWGGVGLGLLELCCCLKNGLSTRPGGRTHRQKRDETERQSRHKAKERDNGGDFSPEDCGTRSTQRKKKIFTEEGVGE